MSAADEAVYKVGRCKRAGNSCLGPPMDPRTVLSRLVTPALVRTYFPYSEDPRTLDDGVNATSVVQSTYQIGEGPTTKRQGTTLSGSAQILRYLSTEVPTWEMRNMAGWKQTSRPKDSSELRLRPQDYLVSCPCILEKKKRVPPQRVTDPKGNDIWRQGT